MRTLEESRRTGRADGRGEEAERKKEDRENRERRERRLPEKRQQHRAGGSCARRANNLVSNHLTRVTRREARRGELPYWTLQRARGLELVTVNILERPSWSNVQPGIVFALESVDLICFGVELLFGYDSMGKGDEKTTRSLEEDAK